MKNKIFDYQNLLDFCRSIGCSPKPNNCWLVFGIATAIRFGVSRGITVVPELVSWAKASVSRFDSMLEYDKDDWSLYLECDCASVIALYDEMKACLDLIAKR